MSTLTNNNDGRPFLNVTCNGVSIVVLFENPVYLMPWWRGSEALGF